jgi:hypothetical protein
MASKRISQEYIERIRAYGMERVFERVESGETVGSIAVSLGMSRGFLSTYLNKDPFSSDLLILCRAVAAYRRLAAHPEGHGRPEARSYAVDGPAIHLGLIKRRAASVEFLPAAPRVVQATAARNHAELLAALQAPRASDGTSGSTFVNGQLGL